MKSIYEKLDALPLNLKGLETKLTLDPTTRLFGCYNKRHRTKSFSSSRNIINEL